MAVDAPGESRAELWSQRVSRTSFINAEIQDYTYTYILQLYIYTRVCACGGNSRCRRIFMKLTWGCRKVIWNPLKLKFIIIIYLHHHHSLKKRYLIIRYNTKPLSPALSHPHCTAPAHSWITNCDSDRTLAGRPCAARTRRPQWLSGLNEPIQWEPVVACTFIHKRRPG